MEADMRDKTTLANINLYAIIRNLEDLCSLDQEMGQLVENQELTIMFKVKRGPVGRVIFSKGQCKFARGKGKSDVILYFKSPEHFNDMLEGKGTPIPLKGFTKLKFLTKDFTKLTDKLSYYLRATDEDLKDESIFNINTILLFYTAFHALAEIGNWDPMGKLNCKRIPDGRIQVAIENGPAVILTVRVGNMTVTKGRGPHKASMTIKSFEAANGVLNGKIDPFSCIASGDLELKGFIPMLDHMNKLLGQVPGFLS